MLVNEEIYNLNLSDNLFLSRVKKFIPITISFIPRIEYKGEQYPISNIIKVIESRGCDYLIENFEPTITFALFKEEEQPILNAIFLNDMNEFKNNFATPVLKKLLDIIGGPSVLEDLLLSNIFFEIRDSVDAEDFIEYMDDGIDSIFEMFNEHIDEVEEWLRWTYNALGETWQLNYVRKRLEMPDLILDFDDKLCGVFKTELATTYYLPNGL